MRTNGNDAEAGYTVAEMIVAVGVVGLLGLVFFAVLQSGLVLSAKNTAVNAAHQEARDGIMHLLRDIHGSISVPQLRDTGFAWVSPTPAPSATPPTAAGVSFQNVGSGPNWIWQDPGNPNLIMIKDNPNPPEPGMRLIVPGWGQEDDIVKVTANGTANHSNVFTAGSIETTIGHAKAFGGTQYAIVYYTNRNMYLVRNGSYIPDASGDYSITVTSYTSGLMDRFALQNGSYVPSATGTYVIDAKPYTGTGQRYRYENGELHFYQWRQTGGSTLYWKDVGVVARYISSPKPFSVPLNKYGTTNNKYVKVKLTARDPKSSNRGYLSTAALLDTEVDYRSRLTLYQ